MEIKGRFVTRRMYQKTTTPGRIQALRAAPNGLSLWRGALAGVLSLGDTSIATAT